MGLLDNINGMFGTDMEDPRTQATLALAQQLLGGRGNGMARLTGGMQGYGQVMADAKQSALKQRLLDAQIAETMAQAQERAAVVQQRQRQAQQSQMFQQALTPQGMSAGQAAGMPGGMSPENAARIGERQPTDWGSLAARFPDQVDLIKKLSESQDFGKSKVARTIETTDANGRPVTLSVDEFNRPIGKAAPKPVEKKLADMGGTQMAYDPFGLGDGQQFKKTQSAESIASNATTMRGQNMTDARTRDFNAVQVEANNIKRAEGQQTKDMTKGGQLASFDTMLGTLDRLGSHPGLARSVGIPGVFPTMPGSDSANFQAELESFQSQAFIPMVSQLKGMGALSDAEGKKLTAAVGALNPRMGEKAFRESVDRITTEMTSARDRVSGSPSAPRQSTGTTKISSDADYNALPSGATFIGPDGKTRRKP